MKNGYAIVKVHYVGDSDRIGDFAVESISTNLKKLKEHLAEITSWMAHGGYPIIERYDDYVSFDASFADIKRTRAYIIVSTDFI